MPHSRLDPITQLDQLAAQTKPACRFTATTPSQALTWQRRTRQALRRTLGIDDLRPVPLRPRLLERKDRGEFIREKWLLRSTPASDALLYILKPSGATGRLPCMLALHGHGYGAKDIVGLWEDGGERYTAQYYHYDFAAELARRGFLVAAPEISCFGERQSDYSKLEPGQSAPSTCHNASTYAMMLGRSIIGLRIWDAIRVVDYLSTRRDADTSRLGAMGLSGGGTHAFFSACIDQRIRATVISGYFCNWRHSILAMQHCTCNFVPGLLQLGQLSDLAGLIAPRPLLVENGDHDPIFPIQHVRRTVHAANRAWQVLQGPPIETDYFEGGHQIHGNKAYPFLQRQLGLG